MATTTIQTYTHVCIVQDGPMKGNEHIQDVDAWAYELGYTCDICGESLVTTEQLLAHIYKELTK